MYVHRTLHTRTWYRIQVQVLYTAQPCMTARFIIPPNSWNCQIEKKLADYREWTCMRNWVCPLYTVSSTSFKSTIMSVSKSLHFITSMYNYFAILPELMNYCQSFTIYSFVTETSRINSPTKLFGAHLAFFKYHLSSLFAFSGTYSLVIFILILLSCLFYYRNVIFSAHASLVAMVTSIITSTNS